MEKATTALWLPEGSIRAILALSLTGAVIGIYAFTGKVATELVTLDGMVIAWYFKRSEPGGVTK